MFWDLSLSKNVFALSQLNLNGKNDSLQRLCLRSFSRCSVQFGKDFELGLRFSRDPCPSASALGPSALNPCTQVASHRLRQAPLGLALAKGFLAFTFLVLLLLLLLLLRHAPSIDFERIAPAVALLFGESVARRFDPPTDKTSYEYAVPPLHRRWLVGN